MADIGERLGGDDIHFTIDQPLRVIIGGPPHSGKSTLMNLLEDRFQYYQIPVELLDLDLSSPTPLKAGFTEQREKKAWTSTLADEARSMFEEAEGVQVVLGDSVGLISEINEIISQPADVAILLVSGGHGDYDTTYRKVVRKWKEYYEDIHKPLLVVLRSTMNPADESMFDPQDNYGVIVGMDRDAYDENTISGHYRYEGLYPSNACLEGIVFEIAQSFDMKVRSPTDPEHLALLNSKWPELKDKKTWTPPAGSMLGGVERAYFQERGRVPADQRAESGGWDEDLGCFRCGMNKKNLTDDGYCESCVAWVDSRMPPFVAESFGAESEDVVYVVTHTDKADKSFYTLGVFSTYERGKRFMKEYFLADLKERNYEWEENWTHAEAKKEFEWSNRWAKKEIDYYLPTDEDVIISMSPIEIDFMMADGHYNPDDFHAESFGADSSVYVESKDYSNEIVEKLNPILINKIGKTFVIMNTNDDSWMFRLTDVDEKLDDDFVEYGWEEEVYAPHKNNGKYVGFDWKEQGFNCFHSHRPSRSDALYGFNIPLANAGYEMKRMDNIDPSEYKLVKSENLGAESFGADMTQEDLENLYETQDVECNECGGILNPHSSRGPYKKRQLCDCVWSAESFGAEDDLTFQEWADQEMMTHGKPEPFDDWLDDELSHHGDNVSLHDWGNHELDSHYERYGAENMTRFEIMPSVDVEGIGIVSGPLVREYSYLTGGRIDNYDIYDDDDDGWGEIMSIPANDPRFPLQEGELELIEAMVYGFNHPRINDSWGELNEDGMFWATKVMETLSHYQAYAAEMANWSGRSETVSPYYRGYRLKRETSPSIRSLESRTRRRIKQEAAYSQMMIASLIGLGAGLWGVSKWRDSQRSL